MNLKTHSIGRTEYWAAISMGVSSFFTLFGYETLRSSANTLFSRAYGAENLPVVTLFLPIVLLALLAVYGKLLSRLGPQKTLFSLIAGSGLIFVLSYFAILSGSRISAAILYIFKECYVVLIVEQYWSFLNSILKKESGKLLNGPIIGLSSLGAIAGSFALSQLAIPFGTEKMLLLSALLMLPAALIANWGYRKCGEPREDASTPPQAHSKDLLGISLFRAYPKLLLIAAIVVASQILSTLVTMRFQIELQANFPNADQQTAYSGNFHMFLNMGALFFQFVVAPLMLKNLSIGLVQILVPGLNLALGLYALSTGNLFSVGAAYLGFKCLDYSLFKASKEILYIPYSFDVRYRAKQLIDSFGYRAAKSGTSAVLILMKSFFTLNQGLYALLSVVSAGVWILATLPIVRDLGLQRKKDEL